MANRLRTGRTPMQEYLRYVQGARDRLYAVADAAREEELAFAARDRFGLQTRSIFKGELAECLDHVAPHLIAIEQGSDYVDLWAEHLGSSAGILLLSEAATDELWTHLRSIFVVTDEAGEEFSFRYYDPRVLRVYLPTCTAEEAREFFGPIRRILVESERQGVMLSCGPDLSGAKITERLLQVGPAAELQGGMRK